MKHEGSPWRLDAHAERLLRRYQELLLTYAIPRGMISVRDASHVRERHIDDSLRATALLRGAASAVDIGSGAGLPGVPVAIVAPDVDVLLTEPRRARVAFLELVVDELDLPNASVHGGRVEDLRRTFDVALARGFGDAAATWAAAERVLTERGRLLYWGGASFDVTRDAPLNARLELHEPLGLESQGPVVIMARQ